MINTTIGILSVATYVAWTATVIYDRYQKDLKNYKHINPVLTLEILFNVYLLYLLINADSAFLAITILTFLLHVGIGIYTEVFRPQAQVDDRVMLKYWSYIGIDTGLSILTYFLVINTSL